MTVIYGTIEDFANRMTELGQKEIPLRLVPYESETPIHYGAGQANPDYKTKSQVAASSKKEQAGGLEAIGIAKRFSQMGFEVKINGSTIESVEKPALAKRLVYVL